jgi:hypothetical protein
MPPVLQTDKPTVVSQYIYDILSDNAAMRTLGLEDVWDGEQNLIPRIPAISIVVGSYSRELTGVPFRTDNVFTIFLMMYHAKIQDIQLNQRECNARAEAVMDFLHTDKTMGGNVIHGYVVAMEPGYLAVGRSMTYVTRLTWTGLTKTLT